MVRHVHDGRDYWTLPGGGIEAEESDHQAAKREVMEETGVEVEPLKLLFVFKAERSISHCVLMTTPNAEVEVSVGIDPEEQHLPEEDRMLRDAAWHEISAMKDDPMVSRAIDELRLEI
jgi:8-oxo-dGTP diphosphatase